MVEYTFKRLEEYDWPGNARELRNVIERAVLMSSGKTVRVQDLPSQLTDSLKQKQDTRESGLDAALAEIEKSMIRQALHDAGENQSRAARLLQINRTTLISRMKRLGI